MYRTKDRCDLFGLNLSSAYLSLVFRRIYDAAKRVLESIFPLFSTRKTSDTEWIFITSDIREWYYSFVKSYEF
jgi:hypothetical protein